MQPDLAPKVQPPIVTTWIGFAAMCTGMFMAILDVQVVATSLPTIQGALGISPDQMSLVQTAYLIAEVIAIPLTGFLTQILSMRWLFVLAISIFTVASLGCAASAMKFAQGKFARPINSYEHEELAFGGLYLGKVNMEKPNRIALEPGLGRRLAIDLGKAADRVTLETAMQRGTCQIGIVGCSA